MKLRNILFVFIGLLTSCLGSENKSDNSSTKIESLYTNEFVSVGVMEKLDDFIASEQSNGAKSIKYKYFNMVFFSNDSGCYVSFMECPKTYNHKEIIGHFEYEGNEIIVYLDDSRCSMGFVNVENLSNKPMLGLLDIADTNNLSFHRVYSSSFIVYELYSPEVLIYEPF